MFQAITPSRILQIFIIFLGGGIFFLILAILILRKGKNRANITISGFFIFVFIGVLLNAIYALLPTHSEENIVVSLHILTFIFVCYAQIFLFISNLILLKSERLFTMNKQLIIMGVYIVLLLTLFFIPEGVRINESTHYRPQWNLLYFIYANIIWIGFAMIPTTITSILIYKKLEDKTLKKRWLMYLIGTIMMYIEIFGVGVLNLINDPYLRLIWNIYDLTVPIAIYLIYYGIVRQLKGADL